MLRFRAALVAGLFALGCALQSGELTAAELVMFERGGCVWCQRWNQEIGPIYSKTEEGQRAPLRRLDLDRDDRSGLRLREPVLYTPTFVLVENGHEIGRLTGYINDELFWGSLGSLLSKIGSGQQ